MSNALLDQFDLVIPHAAPMVREPYEPTVASDWRDGLPVLRGDGVTLRELCPSDAAALFAMLTADEITRFISPPPANIEGFERFIAWSARERAAGRLFCFGIVPDGFTDAVGLVQVRALAPGFVTAEWGFAIGSPFWGRGIFRESAKMVVDFAIRSVGVHRLEARAAACNGRGNGALRKLGAVEEAVLRGGFSRNGDRADQILWSILADDWAKARARALQAKTVWGARIH